MKAILVMLVILSFVFGSCKKDYVCTCTYAATGGTVTSNSYEMKSVKPNDAKDACNQMGANWIAAGGTCDYK